MSGAFEKAGRNLLFTLSPETAHGMSVRALKLGLVPSAKLPADDRMKVHLAGLHFPNPVGLAAGYDKNGEVPDAILRLGFGFTEVGTVTPMAQGGNPKPRIFRLEEHRAVINRLGFNNEGHSAMLARLKAREGRGGIVGVNIGANKQTEDFIADYEAGIACFQPFADYFTVNISSPNTPGLRDLQTADLLSRLLERVFAARDKAPGAPKPVFVKLAPDLRAKEMDEMAKVVIKSPVDGLVISNTTIGRNDVSGSRLASEAGGLSGAPLFELSTAVLAQMRQRVGDKLPIIGVGGIDSTERAIEKLEAGANLVQLYTGMIYEGPGLAQRIVRGLCHHLDKNEFHHISEITGTGTDEWARKF